IESTGKPLVGEDTSAEEEARAVADNVRLAMAAAQKRALPAPAASPALRQRPIARPPVKQADEEDFDEVEADEAEYENQRVA
ncbi:MAG TPA: hypothetical protein VHB73_01290, partial [Alphaproteobacteria bacterium]|nr:hypothetical protein [Alphaproteobacteria bacterium]